MKCKKVIHILSTSYPHKDDNLYTHLSTRLLLNFSEKTDLSTLSTLLLLLLRNILNIFIHIKHLIRTKIKMNMFHVKH